MPNEALPPLPEGFVLDQPRASLPPLPAGFVLDPPTAPAPAQDPGIVESFMRGAKRGITEIPELASAAGSAIMQGARAIPEAASGFAEDLVSFHRDPAAHIAQNLPSMPSAQQVGQTAETVGSLASAGGGALAGAKLGTALGSPGGPVGMGVGSVLGAGIGGGLGLTGFDVAAALAKGEEPPTAPQMAEQAGYDVSQGAALAGGAKGLGLVGRGIGATGQKMGRGMRRAAQEYKLRGAGVTTNDIKKGFRKRLEFLDEAGEVTDLKRAKQVIGKMEKSLREVTKDGFFDKMPDDANEMYLKWIRKTTALGKKVDNLAEKAEKGLKEAGKKAGAKLKLNVDFSDTEELLDAVRTADVTKAENLKRTFEAFKNEWKESPRSFEHLLETRRKLAKMRAWTGTQAAQDDFTKEYIRTLYSDVKRSLEKHYDALVPDEAMVGQFKKTNELLSSYLDFDEAMIAAAAKDGPLAVIDKAVDTKSLIAAGAMSLASPVAGVGAVLPRIGGQAKPFGTARMLEGAAGRFVEPPSRALSFAGQQIDELSPLAAALAGRGVQR